MNGPDVRCDVHWERGISTRNSLRDESQHLLQRQSNVLHARYLHVRVLLYRPTILRFCQKMVSASQPSSIEAPNDFKKDENLRSRMNVQSSVICVTTSIDLISSLHDSTTKSCDGAWWYTTFYLCTAATVLILAKACHRLHQYTSIDKIREAWTLCCKTLGILINRGHPVNHALEGLCNMYEKFVGESSTQGTTQSHSSLPELASASAVETQQDLHSMVSDSVRDSPFAADSLHGRHLRNFPGQAIPKDLESSTMQPLLDFMTQDINLMPFGLIDESWWDLDQMANPEMSFDG